MPISQLIISINTGGEYFEKQRHKRLNRRKAAPHDPTAELRRLSCRVPTNAITSMEQLNDTSPCWGQSNKAENLFVCCGDFIFYSRCVRWPVPVPTIRLSWFFETHSWFSEIRWLDVTVRRRRAPPACCCLWRDRRQWLWSVRSQISHVTRHNLLRVDSGSFCLVVCLP